MREGAGDGIAACSWVFLGFVIIPLQPLQGFFKRVFQDAGWGVVPLISSSCARHGVVSRELHSFCRLGEPACETVWVSWWCSSLRNPIQFLSGPSGLFGRLLPKSIEFWMTHTNLDFFHEFHRVSSFQRWSWMTACNAQSIFAFCIAWCSPISDISDIMPIPLSVWSALQSFGTKPWTVEMECCVFPCLHMFAPFGLCQHNNIIINWSYPLQGRTVIKNMMYLHFHTLSTTRIRTTIVLFRYTLTGNPTGSIYHFIPQTTLATPTGFWTSFGLCFF